METTTFTNIKFTQIILVLLNLHIVNGGVVSTTSGNKYIGESFTITFTITPTYTSAVILQNGGTQSSCFPGCVPTTQNSVTFNPIGTGITVVFNPVSSTHQGDWRCDNSDGNFTIYKFTPETRSSPTVTTEMSSTSTSQDQTTSSQNPSNAPFYTTQKTETTIMTTPDNDFTSASLHVSSGVTTSIKTESDTGTSQDQTTSSQNPSVDAFTYTEKTETTIMTTIENGLTSTSLHVSSEVTTPLKTESDNLTDLGVSAIIAIAISGFLFLFLIIILIICCCQYYQKYSKKNTSEQFQEIHDEEVPKFWSSFDGHRYGNNLLHGSTVHLAHGFNQYQGEHYGGYTVPPTDQFDNFNCRRSGRKNITENPKYQPKHRQGKISYRFPHSIPDNMIHRYDRNGKHTYALHENNQITRKHYRGQAVSSPRRSEHRGACLPDDYINHYRRRSPYKNYIQNHVPRYLDGLTIYQG